jgi:hypothetical protein
MTMRIMYNFCLFPIIKSTCYEDSGKYGEPAKKVNMDSHPHLEYAPISDLTNRKYYKFLYMSREFFYFPLLLFKNFKDLILNGPYLHPNHHRVQGRQQLRRDLGQSFGAVEIFISRCYDAVV